MNNLFFTVVLVLLVSACSNKQKIPEVNLNQVSAENIIDTPDRDLMRLPPQKERLKEGTSNGEAATVISNNNIRAAIIERRLQGLQKYVCNMFKYPVGESCEK